MKETEGESRYSSPPYSALHRPVLLGNSPLCSCKKCVSSTQCRQETNEEVVKQEKETEKESEVKDTRYSSQPHPSLHRPVLLDNIPQCCCKTPALSRQPRSPERVVEEETTYSSASSSRPVALSNSYSPMENSPKYVKMGRAEPVSTATFYDTTTSPTNSSLEHHYEVIPS